MNNIRKYGIEPLTVVLVHGGPGAPGEMAPVARELSKMYGVLEPLQTKDSVDGQVEELKTQIAENTKIPVILVGWSWGAWLSFILTAKYPKMIKKLILISSGPFESRYGRRIMPTRLSHLSPNDGNRVKTIIDLFQKGHIDNKLFEEFGKQVSCPVVVIHGDYDPHPFEGVKLPLSKVLGNCKFKLLKNCGHTPWKEKQAKIVFYKALEKELEVAKL